MDDDRLAKANKLKDAIEGLESFKESISAELMLKRSSGNSFIHDVAHSVLGVGFAASPEVVSLEKYYEDGLEELRRGSISMIGEMASEIKEEYSQL